MAVEAIIEVSPAITQAIERLGPQLSTNFVIASEDRLIRIIESPCTTLLMARLSDGSYVAMLTLMVLETPTGVKAFIEDVVVDSAHRGKGLAQELTQEALRRARAAGATKVDLTSSPSRKAGNMLYRKLGFEKRATNAYRFSFR